MDFKEEFGNVKLKTQSIRLRTLSLTILIIFALCFYVVVNVTTNQSFNWIDFAFVCMIQIISFGLYFSEGEVFGQKDKGFLANKEAYNTNANDVNINGEFSELREYCEFEYQERKNRYVVNQCGLIGITPDELEIFKAMSGEQIKKLTSHEYNGKIKFFTKKQVKLLYKLIFEPIPVQKNQPETIMSAIENDGTSKIQDGSIPFKRHEFTKKILVVLVVGLVFGYVGYTLRDGFNLAKFVQIFMYITTLFTTAIMAFSNGETCQKVHKSHFYLELNNFIESFKEWKKNKPKKDERVV